MGFQAVRPAGVDSDGVAEGPTFVSPNFSWFQELRDGAAIQGFVGKNLRANTRWAEHPQRSIHYGLALQSPCPGVDCRCDRGLHLFLEALGRYRPNTDPSGRPPTSWELVPGLQWRLSETWWISGGVLMPGGSPRL